MSMEVFDENARKLYRLLRETPREKLPGLGNCPEYQELYDSALENDPDDYIEFTETMDSVSYFLAVSEEGQGRFPSMSDVDDMPRLVMEEILTGNRPTKV